ncbi:zinc fingers and homeoboxes protein 1 [Protopterus annectens]|uniref:zinc fingers and homeoboxes protein 1 n=1 Tax=Protopterus annectens TaxID=7888 RepID=UPI001CFBAEEF|nr:zinc fingers and homeoboxes protein 1 [Protopterus annectens]XP_043922515.1 zinc fingers and homeoboxes protein 1 [Protopterus annectens]XP_043922516.1 zinc fingers and homeoboxes protein 1 [Protopterus annectens]XP_043922517.1 zinc fingers and homeoboxes protein 1 [Protopterus annectens]
MASKRKSTTPCMVLANEQDLEMISGLVKVPLSEVHSENLTAESPTLEESEAQHSSSGQNVIITKLEGGYDCKYCLFQTPDLNAYTFHVGSKHPDVVFNSSYFCAECNFFTKTFDTLLEHNLKYHSGEENFKLGILKRDNETVFKQMTNSMTLNDDFVQDDKGVEHENGGVATATVTSTSATGISITKTPIMKMKNKTEAKRITVTHSSSEDVEQSENGNEQSNPKEIVADEHPKAAEPVTKSIIASPPVDNKTTIIGPATVIQPGLSQVISAVQTRPNQSNLQKVLVPVTSIPSYNSDMDNNAMLLNMYNKFPYPTASEIKKLSTQNKYTEGQVKIWFCAQRLKHGISWTPEEVEDARRKQFSGSVHTVSKTIAVIPTQISATTNGLQPVLQTCHIVGQPGLVLTQVASPNTVPVSAPVALTVAGLPSQPQMPKGSIQTSKTIQAPVETKCVVTVPDPKSLPQENCMNMEGSNIRTKKTKEQLIELKRSFHQNPFPQEEEIARLMKTTGLFRAEIKKFFSDTRYSQKNTKVIWDSTVNSDTNTAVVIDSGDEVSESPLTDSQLHRQSFAFDSFPAFSQKLKEKTPEQLQVLEESFLKSPGPADEELDTLQTETKHTKREIDCWFSEKRNTNNLKEQEHEGQDSDVGNKKLEDVLPTDENAPSKLKRPAKGKGGKKTKEQLQILKSVFVHTQWPSAEEYDQLAEKTGLPRTDIVGWFGDTRYVWKNGGLKWYYKYHGGNIHDPSGQTASRKREQGRTKGKGRQKQRGKSTGSKRSNSWDRGTPIIKIKTGKTILKDYFLKYRFLNEQDLDDLVARSHMSYEQVREWFAERQSREVLGLELFDDNDDEDEEEFCEGLEDDDFDDDDDDDENEDEENDSDESDIWEPPSARRRISKSDD